jgi:hypothetical protein
MGKNTMHRAKREKRENGEWKMESGLRTKTENGEERMESGL